MALIQNTAINASTYTGGGSWTNSDGLTIYFGVQEALLANGGDYEDFSAGTRVDEFIINLSALITANPTQVSRSLFPNNFLLDRLEIFVPVVAASSGTGTLSIGLWDLTAGATISDTAIASGVTTAILAVGADLVVVSSPAGNTAYGNTYAGANMGLVGYAWAQPPTTSAHQIVITAKAGTAVFQSGLVRCRLYSHRDLGTDTTYSPGGVS